jgi:hypothetical protein
VVEVVIAVAGAAKAEVGEGVVKEEDEWDPGDVVPEMAPLGGLQPRQRY